MRPFLEREPEAVLRKERFARLWPISDRRANEKMELDKTPTTCNRALGLWVQGWLPGWLAVGLAGWLAGWLHTYLPTSSAQVSSLARCHSRGTQQACAYRSDTYARPPIQWPRALPRALARLGRPLL